MVNAMRTSFLCLIVAVPCAVASGAALSADATPQRDRLEGILLRSRSSSRVVVRASQHGPPLVPLSSWSSALGNPRSASRWFA